MLSVGVARKSSSMASSLLPATSCTGEGGRAPRASRELVIFCWMKSFAILSPEPLFFRFVREAGIDTANLAYVLNGKRKKSRDSSPFGRCALCSWFATLQNSSPARPAEGDRLEALGQSSPRHSPLRRPGDGPGPGDLAPRPRGPEPTAGQFSFFLFLAVFEALTFGLGVSFLLFGFVPLKRALGGSSWRTWAAYLAIGWFLVSWWPHDNMHIYNGDDLQGLLYIEYGFHVTLMAAGLVLAYSLLTLLRSGDAGVQSGGAATACVR
jgi:hypothetical protein